MMCCFFNDTATTEIYTLSLHDALPISHVDRLVERRPDAQALHARAQLPDQALGDSLVNEQPRAGARSEEHTSELQSRQYLVCRLLLEKKKDSRCALSYEHHHHLHQRHS